MPVGSSAHRAVIEATLNELLATELIGVLRYRRYPFATTRPLADDAGQSLLRFANAQQEHADRLAERIVQLGGSPQFDPTDLAARSGARDASALDLQDMLGECLLSERTAIETYDDLVRYFEPHDLTTTRLLRWVLSVHVGHAEELTAMLSRLPLPG